MAEALNRHAHGVAVTQELLRVPGEADALRGAGDDDVAGVERVEVRAERDQIGDGEDQIVGVVFLANFTIDRGGQPGADPRGPLVRGGQPRPEAGAVVEGLARVNWVVCRWKSRRV